MNYQKNREISSRLQNSATQQSVFTLPVNPDIKNPPNNSGQQAIITSRPGEGYEGSAVIDNWIEAEKDNNSVLSGKMGKIEFIKAPQNVSSVFGVNNNDLEFVEAPQSGSSVFTSSDNNLEFTESPQQGFSIFVSNNGKFEFSSVPETGKYIITVQDGQIQFVLAPEGDLKLLNNSLEWTDTESCEQ